MIGLQRIAPAALVLAGCQVKAPEPLRPPRPVSAEVRARFELSDQAPPTLEPVHVLGQSEVADEEGLDAPAAAIEFEDLLTSVELHFPLILAAQEEIAIAEGGLVAARGGFDTSLKAKGGADFEGFYQKEQVDVLFEQPTPYWGASFTGGYRLGQGDFADYDGDKKTNTDGEFRVGVNLPLLQDRAIDPRRVKLWQARIERQAADPIVLQKRLEAMQKAADTYWRWVAAGRLREVAVRLLALAENRAEQVQAAVDEGLLPALTLTENQRLIVERENGLVRADRRLQKEAISLSLYWRDAEGAPLVPPNEALPYEFPAPIAAQDVIVPADEALALEQRPEVRSIELQMQQVELDRALARNERLPSLDFGLFASQDIGEAVNVPDDKTDLEMAALVRLSVPLQRREAIGSFQKLDAKLSKLEREAQFLREVVVSDVQDARSALTQSWLRIEQARENVALANELADAERLQLSVGESDLLRVNLREQQAAFAAAGLVDVLQEYFLALATYRAVLGIPHEVEG